MLRLKKDVDVLSATKDLYYSEDDKFTYENGLNIAVAFTGYNNKEEWELDPAYGSLVFNSYSWGNDEDGAVFLRRKELPSHVCNKEELGLLPDDKKELSDLKDQGTAHFFKSHPNSEVYPKMYQKKFLCVDKESLEIYGDFSSNKAR